MAWRSQSPELILLDECYRRLIQMALDLTKLNASVAAIESELARLRALPPQTDPADQAAIDAIAAKLETDATPPTPPAA